MKIKTYKVPFLFTSLAVVVGLWTLFELGLFSPVDVLAGDKSGEHSEEEKIPSIEKFHKALKDREDALSKWEKEIVADKKSLAIKQDLLERQIKLYHAKIEKLEAKIKVLKASNSSNESSFIKVYEKMEAKNAAKILNALDVELTIRVLTSLKPKKAAEIMSKMSPEKARQVTELKMRRSLAGK